MLLSRVSNLLMNTLSTITENVKIQTYEPCKRKYLVHPGGDPKKKYADLKFHPGNMHDETLRRKTFDFPDINRLTQEKLLKDQGLHGAIRYLRQNGIRNIELATLKYNTGDGRGSIQILYAQPPWSKALPRFSVDMFLHGRNTSIGNLAVPAIRSYFNGKAICMLSYRGEESNKGTPYQEALADDVDAAIEFLTKHKRWETERINFVASSLGCDILTNMFARRYELYSQAKEEFGNVTMIAPFSSLKDITDVSIGRYRIIPRQVEPTTAGLLYPFRKLIAKLFKNPILSLYDNLHYLAAKVHSVKIFASKLDEYIPIQQTRRIYQKLKELMGKERVSLKEFSHMKHGELCQSVT